MKHLRLHLRSTRDKKEISSKPSDSKKDEEGSDFKDCPTPPLEVPFITPVNEPTGDDATGKARMTNLLNENPATRVMSSEELKMMPNLSMSNLKSLKIQRSQKQKMSLLQNRILALISQN